MSTQVRDVLAPGLRAVLVGTRGRSGSPHVHDWYDGAGNHFWTLLHLSGLTPQLLTPADADRLPQFGLGLTDLVWDGGVAGMTALHRALRRAAPTVVAFVSKTAATSYAREARERLPRDYGVLSWRVAGRPAFVLPGPSGANNAMSVPRRAAMWRDLGDFADSLA